MAKTKGKKSCKPFSKTNPETSSWFASWNENQPAAFYKPIEFLTEDNMIKESHNQSRKAF